MIRTIIRERVISVVMVLGGAGLLMAVVAQISAIQWVGRLLGGASLFNKAFGWTVGAVSSFLLDVLTFALLFKFLPPVPIRSRYVWPASVLCALVWVAAGEFLTLYGALIGDSRSAYGAIGGLFAAIIWMKIVSQALFFGAELCKVSVMQAGGSPKFIGGGAASTSSGSDCTDKDRGQDQHKAVESDHPC